MKSSKYRVKKNLIILFIICSVAAVLANVTLEVGDIPRTSRVNKLYCPKKGRCYWTSTVVTSELRFVVKAAIVDVLAGVLASILLVIGEDTGIPYCHLPWLFLSFKSLVLTQGPAIAVFGYSALPVDKYSTITFMILSTFLYALEWSLWCDMANSCRILWMSRNNESMKQVLQDKLNIIRTQSTAGTGGKNSRPDELSCSM